MRVINETAINRVEEDKVVAEFVDHLSKRVSDLVVWRADRKYLSRLDAILQSNNKLLFVEAKIRTTPMNAYKTYLISASKMENLQAAAAGHKAALLVKWTDATAVYYVQPEGVPTDVRVQMGGRFDRGQTNDVEPCWHIPVANFKPIPTNID